MDYLQRDKNSTSQSVGEIQEYLRNNAGDCWPAAIRGARIYNEAMLSISVMVMIISFVVFTVLQYNKWKAKAARRRKSTSFSTARSPGGSVHHGEHKGFTWSADSTLEGGIPGGDIVNLNIINHNNNNTKTTTIANTTNGSSHWASRGSVV